MPPCYQMRPYCTQLCLRGLTTDGSLDFDCPNLSNHRLGVDPNYDKHLINRCTFLSLLKDQLIYNPDEGCEPTDYGGATGILFRITLLSHGYVFVAKGTTLTRSSSLFHEESIYTHLQKLQGDAIPVCLGVFGLGIPWYHEWLDITHMLVLSYSGRRVERLEEGWEEVWGKVEEMGVSHGDLAERNILWCEEGVGGEKVRRLMVIDFDKAKVREGFVRGGKESGESGGGSGVESGGESGGESSGESSWETSGESSGETSGESGWESDGAPEPEPDNTVTC
ncbi:MAG: hypothetical protein M1813_008511 [Trichoglossum hirsutum]|nr:MAG: hypothetical protein M1813_008511 [Trichoglossum hirsutum]